MENGKSIVDAATAKYRVGHIKSTKLFSRTNEIEILPKSNVINKKKCRRNVEGIACIRFLDDWNNSRKCTEPNITLVDRKMLEKDPPTIRHSLIHPI